MEPRLLLQRIHAASRHLARDKDIVLSKKQLVNELLLTPACRAMFHASDAAALNQALAHASHTYSRLELGQTALNNAKVNLTSCASLHLGRSSQHESTRIKVITFVAVAGLAPFLLTATMSMNLSVPFMQANGFRKSVSFYVIVAVVAAWIAVWGIVMFIGNSALGRRRRGRLGFRPFCSCPLHPVPLQILPPRSAWQRHVRAGATQPFFTDAMISVQCLGWALPRQSFSITSCRRRRSCCCRRRLFLRRSSSFAVAI